MDAALLGLADVLVSDVLSPDVLPSFAVLTFPPEAQKLLYQSWSKERSEALLQAFWQTLSGLECNGEIKADSQKQET